MTPKNRIVWVVWITLCGLILFLPLPEAKAQPGERLIQVLAGNYSYTPGIIRVNQGDTLTIELISTDVAHGLYVDDYGLEIISEPGQTSRLTFKADRSGSFRLRCSLTCGDLHPFMIGKLNVGQNFLMLRAAGLSLLAAFGGLILNRSQMVKSL